MKIEELAKVVVNMRLGITKDTVIDTRTEEGQHVMEILNTVNSLSEQERKNLGNAMSRYASTLSRQKQDQLKRLDMMQRRK